MKKRKTYILVLDRDDPERELDFEIEFQLSLTPSERYEMMDRLVRDGLALLRRHGRTDSPSIVTRT